MDMFDGIVVGAAAAAIGTIVAFKYLNRKPQGGAQPIQPNVPVVRNFGDRGPLLVYDLIPTPDGASPVAQVNPITEAAYNQQPVTFEHAFGPGVNVPAEEAVLPQ